jgi:hypothetical protein
MTDSTEKFYQVLYEGRYGLYCNRRVIRTENAIRKADYSTFAIPILKKAPVYIILSTSGKIISLEKISNTTLLKGYPNDKKALKNLMHDTHLHLKTEEDLIHAVKVIEENKLLN